MNKAYCNVPLVHALLIHRVTNVMSVNPLSVSGPAAAVETDWVTDSPFRIYNDLSGGGVHCFVGEGKPMEKITGIHQLCSLQRKTLTTFTKRQAKIAYNTLPRLGLFKTHTRKCYMFQVTVADLSVAHFLGAPSNMGVDNKLGDYPKLKAHKQRIESLPKIAEWIAKRPKTQV